MMMEMVHQLLKWHQMIDMIFKKPVWLIFLKHMYIFFLILLRHIFNFFFFFFLFESFDLQMEGCVETQVRSCSMYAVGCICEQDPEMRAMSI